MDWDSYYEKFYEWATSTQIKKMSSLTSFGASAEVAEVAQEYMDEKAASRLIKKAVANGVQFTPDEIYDLSGCCDTSAMNELLKSAKCAFTQEQLEDLWGSADDDVLELVAKRNHVTMFADNAGNALVVGLFRIETEGVMIPRPLNKDLIFIKAVRSMRTAEPHQRFVFWIRAFGSAADDALVDVEVFLVAVYMTVHELLQLRNDVNVCVFLHASPFSQLHVVRFGFDRRFLLRLLFCSSPELITDGGLFLLLLLLDVFQRRQQLTVTALCFPRCMTAMDFEQWLTVLRDRVALDPDAVPRQQIEGMVRGAVGRPHSVVVIGNLPLERVHDGSFDFLFFRSQSVCLRRFRCFLRQGSKGRPDLHCFYLNEEGVAVLRLGGDELLVGCLVIEQVAGVDVALIFDSKTHGDPSTPVFRSYVGERIMIRLLMPGDKPRNTSFVLHGHRWKTQPEDPFSRIVPAQGAISVGNVFNI